MQYVSIYIYAYINIYIYTGWIWSYHQPGFAPEAQWYRMPSYSLYLFTWNSSVKPMTVMMSAVNQKTPCLFICVCSVKVFYTVSAKKKLTPTGFSKAGKSFQVQSSSLKGLFVRFKKLIVRDPWKQQWLYISLVSLVVNFPEKIIPPKWGFQW